MREGSGASRARSTDQVKRARGGMKIAFIVGEFPSLSQTFVLNQVTGLLALGHEVEIFPAVERDEPGVRPDVRSYHPLPWAYYRRMPANKLWRVMKAIGLFARYVPRHSTTVVRSLNWLSYGKNALSLQLFYGLLPFLDRGRYDIIHCHFGPMGIFGAFLKAVGIKGRLVVTFHAHDLTVTVAREGRGVYRGLFQIADLLMPISDHWKHKLIELGCAPQKIVVHRMGVDTERFRFAARVYPHVEPMKLLTVSRLVEKKGVEYGIRALAIVLQTHPEWSIHYDIVGEGPLRSQLEAVVGGLGLRRQVSFLGPRSHEEVQELMMQDHMFLLPSVTSEDGDQDGIPVVLMEAMATGLPVLSSLHSGIPELVIDGQSGFLVPERDVNALAERLGHLIQHPEIWPDMGRAGRAMVEQHYNIYKLNRRLEEIYEALLAGRMP